MPPLAHTGFGRLCQLELCQPRGDCCHPSRLFIWNKVPSWQPEGPVCKWVLDAGCTRACGICSGWEFLGCIIIWSIGLVSFTASVLPEVCRHGTCPLGAEQFWYLCVYNEYREFFYLAARYLWCVFRGSSWLWLDILWSAFRSGVFLYPKPNSCHRAHQWDQLFETFPFFPGILTILLLKSCFPAATSFVVLLVFFRTELF